MKVDRFPIALIAVTRDTNAVLASKMSQHVPHRDANVRGLPHRKNSHSVIDVAIDTPCFRKGFFFPELQPRRLDPGLSRVGKSRVAHAVGGRQVVAQEERRGVQGLRIVVESVGGKVRGQQVSQVDIDMQQIPHRVGILRPV
jgi:hypothetical protein